MKARVKIVPGEGRMAATVAVELAPETSPPSGTVDFFLNRGLSVDEVTVQGERPGVMMESDVARFPFAPTARRVTLALPEEDEPGGRAGLRRRHLDITYSGTLSPPPGGMGQIAKELTELNLYGSWFPLFEGPQGFDYDVEISMPEGYEALNGGDEIPPEPEAGAPEPGFTRRRFAGRSSAGDVAILLTSGYADVPVEAPGLCDVEVRSTELPHGMRESAAAEAAWACDFLARKAGSDTAPGAPRPRLLLVIVPREDPGYARPPLVVAPAGWFVESGGAPETDEEEAGWRRRLFHEIAHGFAPLADTLTYDDWINEGLAEHLALQALAARRGEEAAARYYRRFLLEIAERPATPPGVDEDRPPRAPVVTEPREDASTRGDASPPADASRLESAGGDRRDGEEVPRSLLLPAISATQRNDPDASLLYYRKGALVFRMIEGLAGSTEFTRVLADLRRRFPVTGAARLDTDGLVAALERSEGGPFGWVRSDWVDGTSLPRLDPDPEVRIERESGTPGWRVSVEIAQGSGRPFALRLPVIARRGPVEERRIVSFSGPSASGEWLLPFKPREVLVDPERVVPRFDPTVDHALILRESSSRMKERTAEGIRAERRRELGPAIARYDEAAAEDPSAAYPLYRKGRALSQLGQLDAALEAHRRSIVLGEREAKAWDRASISCATAPAMACSEPTLWVDSPYELRAWNWIRIGQIEERNGHHDKAVKAFEKALEAPDRLGAHDTARACLRAPCVDRAGG